jgi:hypothetical protein
MSLLNEANFKYTFLPPVRRNTLRGSNPAPVYIESHAAAPSRERAFLAVSVDRFALHSSGLAADEPPKVEIVDLGAGRGGVKEPGTYPKSTARIPAAKYIWNTSQMPALRMAALGEKEVPFEKAETIDERKKRLIFEQKNVLEAMLFEKSMRTMRSDQLTMHSRKVAKKNAQFRSSLGLDGSLSGGRDKASGDKWGSINPKDIKLKKEIIDQIYSTKTRGIRCYQKWNPFYYGQTVNDTFEKMEKEVLKREEKEKSEAKAKIIV